MKEVILKPNKHLVLMTVSADISADSLQVILNEINKMTEGNIKFLVTQPATEITVLKLED